MWFDKFEMIFSHEKSKIPNKTYGKLWSNATLCSLVLSPEHQAEVEPLLSHQVASKPVGGRVGEEDDALGEAVAGSVHIRLLQGRFIRSVELGRVDFHEAPLFPQACDGADVVQCLTRNL